MDIEEEFFEDIVFDSWAVDVLKKIPLCNIPVLVALVSVMSDIPNDTDAVYTSLR